MNYIGHHEVALLHEPEATPDFLFGSVVHDLSRMSGTRRFLASITDNEVQRGMRFHTDTNTTFDGQLEISEFEKDLEDSLKSIFPDNWRIAHQAARAGKDLLFDGLFSQTKALDHLYNTLNEIKNGNVTLSSHETPRELMNAVERIYISGPPRYHEIDTVIRSLYLTLQNTRTPLPIEKQDDIGLVFANHQIKLLNIGPLAIKQTLASLQEKYSN